MMGAVDKFLYKLENFDKENIPPKVVKALQQYLNVSLTAYSLLITYCFNATFDIRDQTKKRRNCGMGKFLRIHL